MVNAGLAFSKMHGAGNDFVVLDLRNAEPPSQALCRVLADRHRGVGCDLILGVLAPQSESAVAAYRIWTADGCTSQQCGNGARCIAAWVIREGLTAGPYFSLESPSGVHAVEAHLHDTFRINMGTPQIDHDRIPITNHDCGEPAQPIDFGVGLFLGVSTVWLGNPHVVIEVDSVEDAPVETVGRSIQDSPNFPTTVNVGFVEVISRTHVRLRVFEYGAGETLACGSGACAAAASLMARGRIDNQVLVTQRGGDLTIDWTDARGSIAMTGSAKFVFDGVLSEAPNSIEPWP